MARDTWIQTRIDTRRVVEAAEHICNPYATRAELRDECQHRYGWGRARTYRLIANAVQSGDLIETTPSGRMLHLAQSPLAKWD